MASLLRYLLVDHPTISSFSWSSTSTPGASLRFLAATVLLYLALTLLLRNRLPSPPPTLLHLLSATHSLILLLLSFLMALGTYLSLSPHPPTFPFCFPPSTSARGPVFFWAYVFYLSKIYELLDTLLIILSGGKRLTFLHVYHHAVVVCMCYMWLEARQSLLPVTVITNAVVHVVMYGYYFSASVGWRWPARWKRRVTELQIWQFRSAFVGSVVFLWLHFRGAGCEGFWAWVFGVGFNASLLVLFLDFRSSAYSGGDQKRKDG